MYPEDTHAFVRLLEQADQLHRVRAGVDPYLELATIVDRVSKATPPGKALLFEAVRGSSLPVAANLFGSVQRVAWALGATDLRGVAERLERDLASSGLADPDLALAALCARPAHQPARCALPAARTVTGPAQGLAILPQIKAWPGDGGCYLTLAQVVTSGPRGGAQNSGMYRVQMIGRQQAVVRCQPGSGMAAHLRAWHAAGQAMPVSIVLGGPPVLTWAAGAPLPPEVDEAAFCGYLTGERLLMSACELSGLQVPATADVVIEGEIAPGAMAREGPFGNHTGGYVAAAPAPLLTVRRVAVRSDAICPWTLVGPPPMEDIHLARVSERLFLPLVRRAVATVRELHMPAVGIFHRAALVSVDPGEERTLPELATVLWQTRLLSGARLLVLCAADVDLHDAEAVCWRSLNRIDWARDMYHSSGRLALDARRLPAGGAVKPDPAVLEAVLRRWPEFGFGARGE